MMTFARRVLGAAGLNSSVYEEIEADRGSLGQAVVVVLMSVVAAGVGARGFGATADIPMMTFVAFAAWASWALLTYQIGTRLMPDVNTRSDVYEMMRTMGFAAAPGILRVVGVVPALTTPIFAVTAVWMLLAMIVAVRQALDYRTTARAVAVCTIGWVLAVVVVMILGLLSPPVLSAQVSDSRPPAAFRLHVVRGNATIEATAVLVQTETTAQGTYLYFVTSAALFRNASGVPLARATSITITTGTHDALQISAQDVSLPQATLVDVAVLKVRAGTVRLTPPTLTLEPPTDTFYVSGLDRDGRVKDVQQRVRRLTTLRLLGDRSLDPIIGCEGTPAATERGIFGVVTACKPGDLPVIVPFAAIANWIRTYVPGGLRAAAPQQTSLEFLQRDFPGPLLTVSCGEVQSGTVDVPFKLEPGQSIVDVSPSLMNRTALRLGDVTVLSLDDRRVALRFTLTGQEPPRFQPPTPCPQGQALVSVRLDIVSNRKP